jgi:hypothetical protein
VDFNKIYRAPSLPKLSKRNISSSVLRGASVVSAAPKLQKSSFRFIKPATSIVSADSLKVIAPAEGGLKNFIKPPEGIEASPTGAKGLKSFLKSSEDAEGLKVIKPQGGDSGIKQSASSGGLKQTSIVDSLAETNRILVEIQNQLATDFALRIAEEKEGIKKIKTAESKKRFLTKEGAIEKIKSVGSGLKNQVDKILAPTKSIFQRIIDFFKIILTGIVLNTAFKWLENPENQKKLGQFFGFLAEHWKWVVATLGTVILVDVIAKLVIAAQGIMAAFALLTSPAGLTILATIAAAAATGKFFGDLNKSAQRAVKEEEKRKGRPLTRKEEEDVTTKQVTMFPGMPGMNVAIEQQLQYSDKQKKSKGGEIFKSLAQRFSIGGTVGGKGSGNVDTVPAMLAPGEFVTRTSATRLFKPFLSDINENAGRLFDQFKQAVIGLTNNVAIQKETSEAFNKILEEFNKFLDSEIRKRNKGATGGGIGGGNINIRTGTPSKMGTDVMPSSSGSNVNVSNISINNNISPGSSMMGNAGVIKPRTTPRQEKVYNTISTKPSPRTNIIPINLPPIKSKPPEISTPTRTATDVPNISSVNIANPYMQLTPELYGIFV